MKLNPDDIGWDLSEEDPNVVRAADEAAAEDHGCEAGPVTVTRFDTATGEVLSVETSPAYTPEELIEINRPAGGFFSNRRNADA